MNLRSAGLVLVLTWSSPALVLSWSQNTLVSDLVSGWLVYLKHFHQTKELNLHDNTI